MQMATWKEVADHFKHMADKLGNGIDEGIFDTVVALNMLGVYTRQSCEGHLEWGLPHPWIDLYSQLDLKQKLYDYLTQFYQSREIEFDTVLGFHGFRLQSHGSILATLWTEEERKQRLKAYRSEMAAFTQFLKAHL
jgi:hypothetical protein